MSEDRIVVVRLDEPAVLGARADGSYAVVAMSPQATGVFRNSVILTAN